MLLGVLATSAGCTTQAPPVIRRQRRNSTIPAALGFMTLTL
jgi:hypothetical protein